MQVQSLGWEDPLEKGMAIHSSIFAWKISIDRGLWQAMVHGVVKSYMAEHTHRHTTPNTFCFIFLHVLYYHLTSHIYLLIHLYTFIFP